MSFAIQATGLTKKYKDVTAVNELDLEIPQGTIFGFLGPNGAGKTTTIRMLLGLIQPTSGNATVLGHDIRNERDSIVQKTSAIVESPSMYTFLSGIENLRVFAQTSRLRIHDSVLYATLERVGLKDREKHKVKTYSLGMKQRLGIAATLLNNPQVIFLDEPTNGLDPAGTVEMRDMIRNLGNQGQTIFLSSHILHEVEQLCSNVAIIQKGVTMAQGRVQDLLQEESQFALRVEQPEQAMQILAEHPELQATKHTDSVIMIKAAEHDISKIVRLLVTSNIDVHQVHAKQRSLEEYFLELTGQPIISGQQTNVERTMEFV